MTSLHRVSTDFAARHPEDVARLLADADIEDAAEVLMGLPAGPAASVAACLPSATLDQVLERESTRVSSWLAEARLDDARNLLGRLPRPRAVSLVEPLPDRARRRRLLRYLRYPAHSIGAMVQDVRLKYDVDTPAPDVLADIRAQSSKSTAPVVVALEDGRFAGRVDPWRLLARKNVTGRIGRYLETLPALPAELPAVSAAADPAWRDQAWLPVVDHEGHFLGGVTRARLHDAVADHPERTAGGFFGLLLGDMMFVSRALVARLLTR